MREGKTNTRGKNTTNSIALEYSRRDSFGQRFLFSHGSYQVSAEEQSCLEGVYIMRSEKLARDEKELAEEVAHDHICVLLKLVLVQSSKLSVVLVSFSLWPCHSSIHEDCYIYCYSV